MYQHSGHEAAHDSARPLSYDSLLTDPLIRLVMRADGVTPAELIAVMAFARDAVVAREGGLVTPALSLHSATSGRA